MLHFLSSLLLFHARILSLLLKQYNLSIPVIFQIATSGPNEGYFTEETVLNRVPTLLLILAAIYLVMGLLGENDFDLL